MFISTSDIVVLISGMMTEDATRRKPLSLTALEANSVSSREGGMRTVHGMSVSSESDLRVNNYETESCDLITGADGDEVESKELYRATKQQIIEEENCISQEKKLPPFPWLPMTALCVGMLAHLVVFTNPLPYVAFMVVDFKMADNVDSAGYFAGWITGTFMIGR